MPAPNLSALRPRWFAPSTKDKRSPAIWSWMRYRTPLMVALYFLVVTLGYRAAYELRFEFHTPAPENGLFWTTLPVLVVLRLGAYAHFGVFRSYWQHFGLPELRNLAQGATISSAGFIVAVMLLQMRPDLPRSVILLDWFGAIFLGGGFPFLLRCLREAPGPFADAVGRRTLVVGTGEKAERLLREITRGHPLRLRAVGLVDDRENHQGRWLHGLPVIGRTTDLPSLVARLGIELVIIAVDADKGASMQRAVDACMAAGVAFKTLPSLGELLEGTARVDQLRDVRIQDLLGRPAVQLDLAQVEASLRGRVVLITGGAGSIGAELARQTARFSPARLVLVDQAESELYFIQLELAKSNPGLDVAVVICDVTDESRLGLVFERHRPDSVFHAAAYKHVPLLESNVLEAVRNNVVGTLVVAETAVRVGVKQVLLISTDKAVNPSSVMGATKRIAERIIFDLPSVRGSGTVFRAVRFGNVLASNGSVVPLFERQLAAGGPLTVTHPEVQRYFMTIPEAGELVLQAASLSETAGRIAMLDMGAPVRILDLAERLVRLSGREPHRDVRIVFTGLRPGEKLKEDLTSALENTIPTAVRNVRVVQIDDSVVSGIEEGLIRLLYFVDVGDTDAILAQLCELVPECVAPLRNARRLPVGRGLAGEPAAVATLGATQLTSAMQLNGQREAIHEKPGPNGSSAYQSKPHAGASRTGERPRRI